MTNKDFYKDVLTIEEFKKIAETIDMDADFISTEKPPNPYPYWDKYQLFCYDTFVHSISLDGQNEHKLAKTAILEAIFKMEIKKAENADQVKSILDLQFEITEVRNTPKKEWLDLVEQIIKKNNLLRGRDSLIVPVDIWFKVKRAGLTSNPAIKSKEKPNKQKKPINTFEEAAKDDEALKTMLTILSNKKVIDNQNTLISTAKSLYSLIKRFKQLGYFKNIFLKDLHPLVNTAFKADKSYQHFNQTAPYNKTLT